MWGESQGSVRQKVKWVRFPIPQTLKESFSWFFLFWFLFVRAKKWHGFDSLLLRVAKEQRNWRCSGDLIRRFGIGDWQTCNSNSFFFSRPHLFSGIDLVEGRTSEMLFEGVFLGSKSKEAKDFHLEENRSLMID